MGAADVKNPSLIIEMDAAELAVRLCEANYGLKRPAGLTAQQALDAMDDDVRQGWQRSAVVAMEYLSECVSAGKRPS
jgi:hypothetical protein